VSPWSSSREGVASDDPAATVRREDAERFIEEVRGEDAELASYPRIEERELEAVG
jgi:hypothetical protein